MTGQWDSRNFHQARRIEVTGHPAQWLNAANVFADSHIGPTLVFERQPNGSWSMVSYQSGQRLILGTTATNDVTIAGSTVEITCRLSNGSSQRSAFKAQR